MLLPLRPVFIRVLNAAREEQCARWPWRGVLLLSPFCRDRHCSGIKGRDKSNKNIMMMTIVGFE
jgi:hypothetical protein